MVLRHKPEAANITLDSKGWADVKLLLKHKNVNITLEELEKIVDENDKKRFEFNPNKTKIRARQGHTIAVDVELQPVEPEVELYHGTAEQNKEKIKTAGIKKQSRNHVHLSGDVETAINVGKRYGSPIVFKVNAPQMVKDGIKFFKSNNGVYLTDFVPPTYIELINIYNK